MHELSLAEHLLTLVDNTARAQGFSRVHRLVLGIGRFSCVDSDTLLHCIHHHCIGSLLDGATICCEIREANAECMDCATRFTPDEWPCACPGCGQARVRLLHGRDMILEQLEVS